jgi:predicted DsbA family dithiol-disulfide isomerase
MTDELPPADDAGIDPVPDYLQIDLWTDLVCPWCYIGRHRLEQAIETSGHADRINLVYHSFELDATTRHDTQPILEMLADKYTLSAADAAAMEARVAGLATADGLQYSVDRLTSNSFEVHRVTQLAAEFGLAFEVFDELQRLYFSGTGNPFARETIIEVATAAGVPADEVERVLDSREYADAVRQDERLAAQIGVTGVPFTVFDRRIGVPGAVSVEQFADAIQQALRAGA